MEEVVGKKVVDAPRPVPETVERAAVEQKTDPWMLAVPAIVLAGWLIIGSTVALVLLLVRGTQWMGSAWKCW